MTVTMTAAGGARALPPKPTPRNNTLNRYTITINDSTVAPSAVASWLAFGTTDDDAAPTQYADLTNGDESYVHTIFTGTIIVRLVGTGMVMSGTTRNLDFSTLELGKHVWCCWWQAAGIPGDGDAPQAVLDLGVIAE